MTQRVFIKKQVNFFQCFSYLSLSTISTFRAFMCNPLCHFHHEYINFVNTFTQQKGKTNRWLYCAKKVCVHLKHCEKTISSILYLIWLFIAFKIYYNTRLCRYYYSKFHFYSIYITMFTKNIQIVTMQKARDIYNCIIIDNQFT